MPHLRRSAYTLLEALMALSLAGAALGSLYLTRIGPRSATGSTALESTEARSLEQEIHKMAQEIQEGTVLFYPPPGMASPDGLGFDGVGFVNARGETILYYLEPSRADQSGGSVFRVNVNRRRRGLDRDAEPLLRNVQHMRVNTAPAAPGKEASFVHLDLALRLGAEDSPEDVLQYVTSVFLRNLEKYVPDDLFSAGTPLVDRR